MNNIIVPTFGNYKKRSDIGKYLIIEDENNDKKNKRDNYYILSHQIDFTLLKLLNLLDDDKQLQSYQSNKSINDTNTDEDEDFDDGDNADNSTINTIDTDTTASLNNAFNNASEFISNNLANKDTIKQKLDYLKDQIMNNNEENTIITNLKVLLQMNGDNKIIDTYEYKYVNNLVIDPEMKDYIEPKIIFEKINDENRFTGIFGVLNYEFLGKLHLLDKLIILKPKTEENIKYSLKETRKKDIPTLMNYIKDQEDYYKEKKENNNIESFSEWKEKRDAATKIQSKFRKTLATKEKQNAEGGIKIKNKSFKINNKKTKINKRKRKKTKKIIFKKNKK